MNQTKKLESLSVVVVFNLTETKTVINLDLLEFGT
jgi:hypothetical protein